MSSLSNLPQFIRDHREDFLRENLDQADPIVHAISSNIVDGLMTYQGDGIMQLTTAGYDYVAASRRRA